MYNKEYKENLPCDRNKEKKSQNPNCTGHHCNHHPISAVLRHANCCRCRRARYGRAIRQSPIDVNLLSPVDIQNLHVARVGRLRAIEQALVVGAVVVVITSTLRVLVTDTHDGQRLVLVRVFVRVMVVMAVGIGVCPVE